LARLLHLGECLCMLSLLLVTHAEEQMGIRDVWIDLQRFAELIDGLFGAAREQQSPTQVRINVGGKGSGFLREAKFGNRAVVLAASGAVETIPEMGGRKLRV